MFLEAHTEVTKFNVCRFGNVSHSHGSVIPYWLALKSKNQPLPLTHEDMNRLMFSRHEAAELVNKAILDSQSEIQPFILSQKMKSVNMLKLAKLISNDIVNIGLRPGEKLNETLISEKEASHTFVDGKYIIVKQEKNQNSNLLVGEYSSNNVEFMNKEEMMSTIMEADEMLDRSLLETRVY